MLRFFYCLLFKKFIWVYIVLCDIYIYIYSYPYPYPFFFLIKKPHFSTFVSFVSLVCFCCHIVSHRWVLYLYKNLETTHGGKHRIFVFVVWLLYGLTYLTRVSPIASIFMHMMWPHSSSKAEKNPTMYPGVPPSLCPSLWSWSLRWFHSLVIVNRGSVSSGVRASLWYSDLESGRLYVSIYLIFLFVENFIQCILIIATHLPIRLGVSILIFPVFLGLNHSSLFPVTHHCSGSGVVFVVLGPES